MNGSTSLVKSQNADGRYVTYTYNHLNKPVTKNINGLIAIYEYDLDCNMILYCAEKKQWEMIAYA